MLLLFNTKHLKHASLFSFHRLQMIVKDLKACHKHQNIQVVFHHHSNKTGISKLSQLDQTVNVPLMNCRLRGVSTLWLSCCIFITFLFWGGSNRNWFKENVLNRFILGLKGRSTWLSKWCKCTFTQWRLFVSAVAPNYTNVFYSGFYQHVAELGVNSHSHI